MSELNKISSSNIPKDISQILQYYKINFYPIFAFATAMEAIISNQMLNELRNCFDHLARAEADDHPESNIRKAKNHIDRASLDCAKIGWVACKKDTEATYSSFHPREYSVIDGGKFLEEINTMFKSFKDKSLEARIGETTKMDDNIYEAVNLYMEAVNVGMRLQDAIRSKINELSHARAVLDKGTWKHNLKWSLIGALLGVLLTLIFTPLYNGITSPKVAQGQDPKAIGTQTETPLPKENNTHPIEEKSAEDKTGVPPYPTK